jgi:hypothetical protein
VVLVLVGVLLVGQGTPVESPAELVIPRVAAVLATLAKQQPILLAELERGSQPGAPPLSPDSLAMMESQQFAAMGVVLSKERHLRLMTWPKTSSVRGVWESR